MPWDRLPYGPGLDVARKFLKALRLRVAYLLARRSEGRTTIRRDRVWRPPRV